MPTPLARNPFPVADTGVFPDFGAVGAAGTLQNVAGALLTIVLIVAVLMLIVSGITWAVATAHGNPQAASRGRTGVAVALGAAILAGGVVAWINWLIHLGQTL